MTKYTNHLASQDEFIKATNRLPKKIRSYFEQQAQLTTAFRQTVEPMLSKSMVQLCQVVRYADGEMIVSVSNATLVNHLHYLLPTLLNALKTHNDFIYLNKIHFVYFCDSLSSTDQS